MPAPTSPSNPLQIFLRRPLVGMDTAEAALNLPYKAVMQLIHEKRLRWAFNFAAQIYTRQQVRVLAHSIAAFQKGGSGQVPSEGDEFAGVLKILFPLLREARPGIVTGFSVADLSARLNLKPDRVYVLAEAGWLRSLQKQRRGPGGGGFVEFASVVSFLKKRRIT